MKNTSTEYSDKNTTFAHALHFSFIQTYRVTATRSPKHKHNATSASTVFVHSRVKINGTLDWLSIYRSLPNRFHMKRSPTLEDTWIEWQGMAQYILCGSSPSIENFIHIHDREYVLNTYLLIEFTALKKHFRATHQIFRAARYIERIARTKTAYLQILMGDKPPTPTRDNSLAGRLYQQQQSSVVGWKKNVFVIIVA